MPPQRLRAPLYHSVESPTAPPTPLWQAAVALDPAAKRHGDPSIRPLPPNRRLAEPIGNALAREAAILHFQEDDRWRIVLATVVVCTGVFAAGLAWWQASNPRVVYVPVPSQASAPVATVMTPASRQGELHTLSPTVAAPITNASRNPAAPAMPLTWTPPPAIVTAPAPVNHAARDQQIEDLKARIAALDEDVRCIREHPTDPRYYWHYASSVYPGVDQARRDAYLKELDRQRNDLRRQKWALEGR